MSRPLISYFLSALLMASLASASCRGAKRVDGVLRASCTDEVTGMDFEFIDTFGVFGRQGNDNFMAKTSRRTTTTAQLNEMISTAWEQAGANATEPDNSALVERGFTDFWQNCKAKISGACSNEHTVAWFGATTQLIQSITSIVSEVNTNARETKSPRSICAMKEDIPGLQGRMCVSWANYEYQLMSQEDIDAMATECARNCEALHKSCQFKYAPSFGVAQYFCMSDRPKGCTSDIDLPPACPY